AVPGVAVRRRGLLPDARHVPGAVDAGRPGGRPPAAAAPGARAQGTGPRPAPARPDAGADPGTTTVRLARRSDHHRRHPQPGGRGDTPGRGQRSASTARGARARRPALRTEVTAM